MACNRRRWFSPSSVRRHLVFLSSLTAVSVFCVMWRGSFRQEKTTSARSVANFRTSVEQTRAERSIAEDWCLLQEWRVDWDSMLRPCRGKLGWADRQSGSSQRTHARSSYVKMWSLKPAGKFSRFFIQSVTKEGETKTSGGDSWRVYIRQGPAALAPIVLDLNNGLYEVLFLAAEPGRYYAQVFLDYTLCDGLREPPRGWFVNGTDHGTFLHPQEGILGYIGDDYVIGALRGDNNMSFDIRASGEGLGPSLGQVTCGGKCRLLWDGHGYWAESQWRPYMRDPARGTDSVGSMQPGPRKLGTLWVYGDSIGLRFLESIKKRALCRSLFRNCKGTYNWIYEVRNKKAPPRLGSEFNQSIVVEQIRRILERPEMNRPDSVFLFNLGVHFPISLTFQRYRNLIDAVIKLLIAQENGTKNYAALPIWKSTTAIEKEKVTMIPWPARPLNYTTLRFFTMPRVQLFHAYAMRAMCQANIRVLDVHPISAAFPQGTLDYVHYDDRAFEPVEDLLGKYFTERQAELSHARRSTLSGNEGSPHTEPGVRRR